MRSEQNGCQNIWLKIKNTMKPRNCESSANYGAKINWSSDVLPTFKTVICVVCLCVCVSVLNTFVVNSLVLR